MGRTFSIAALLIASIQLQAADDILVADFEG